MLVACLASDLFQEQINSRQGRTWGQKASLIPAWRLRGFIRDEAESGGFCGDTRWEFPGSREAFCARGLVPPLLLPKNAVPQLFFQPLPEGQGEHTDFKRSP